MLLLALDCLGWLLELRGLLALLVLLGLVLMLVGGHWLGNDDVLLHRWLLALLWLLLREASLLLVLLRLVLLLVGWLLEAHAGGHPVGAWLVLDLGCRLSRLLLLLPVLGVGELLLGLVLLLVLLELLGLSLLLLLGRVLGWELAHLSLLALLRVELAVSRLEHRLLVHLLGWLLEGLALDGYHLLLWLLVVDLLSGLGDGGLLLVGGGGVLGDGVGLKSTRT